MSYPILNNSGTYGKGWYTSCQNYSTVLKSITKISIVDSYQPTGNETAVWDASQAKDQSIKGYIDGTILILAGNGSGKIALAEDASQTFQNFYFESLTEITGLNILDLSNTTNISNMFRGCSLITSLDLSGWDIFKVTDMTQLFLYCNKLATITGISEWDTSSVEKMTSVFLYCYAITSLDLSEWNTSNVTNMSQMFYSCNKLTNIGDVSNWNTSNVTNMSMMFYFTKNITNIVGISNWDVSNVTNMANMFSESGITNIEGLRNWDVSNVTFMTNMFQWSKIVDASMLANWDTSNVTRIDGMFNGCTSLQTLDVSGWNTEKITDMGAVFRNCSALEQIVGVDNWNIENVTNISDLFEGCSSLTHISVGDWNFGSVSLGSMFSGCTSLQTLDVSGWNTSNVTNLYYTFYGCSALTSLDVSNWDTSNVTIMNSTFCGCTSLTSLDVSNWDTSKVTNMSSMFSTNESYTTGNAFEGLDVSNWDTSSCTNMSFMFYGCGGPGTLDVSNWDVSKVTTFDHMFAHSTLSGLDVSKWVTSSAVNMNAMFHRTSNKVLDCSNFDTSKVQFFCQMFEYCYDLERIIGHEKFDTSSGLGFQEMFNECFSIKELDLSNWDTRNAKDGVTCSANGSKTTAMQYMFLNMRSLEKIALGENFSFNGDGTTTGPHAKLPTPIDSETILSDTQYTYIKDADGKWYTTDETSYAPSNIPNKTANTYYAAFWIIYKDGLFVQYGSIKDVANSIRNASGTTEKMTLAEMPTAIEGIEEIVKENVENSIITDLVDYMVCEGGSQVVEGTGKNLCDRKFVNLSITGSSGNYYFAESSSYKSLYIEIEEGKTYSISRSKVSSSRFRSAFTTEIPAANVACTDVTTNYDSSLSIKNIVAPSGAKYLVVYLTNTNEDVSDTRFQIEESTTTTDYEPFGTTTEIIPTIKTKTYKTCIGKTMYTVTLPDMYGIGNASDKVIWDRVSRTMRFRKEIDPTLLDPTKTIEENTQAILTTPIYSDLVVSSSTWILGTHEIPWKSYGKNLFTTDRHTHNSSPPCTMLTSNSFKIEGSTTTEKLAVCNFSLYVPKGVYKISFNATIENSATTGNPNVLYIWKSGFGGNAIGLYKISNEDCVNKKHTTTFTLTQDYPNLNISFYGAIDTLVWTDFLMLIENIQLEKVDSTSDPATEFEPYKTLKLIPYGG